LESPECLIKAERTLLKFNLTILGDSESTVKNHVLEIFAQLRVETRTAAGQLARVGDPEFARSSRIAESRSQEHPTGKRA
jgi:hypothetical protein